MNEVLRPGFIALWAVPREFITQELCVMAIMEDAENIEYVPNEFKTKELYEIIMNNDKDYGYIHIIPTEFLTEEYLLRGLVSENMEYFNDVIPYIKPTNLTDTIREVIIDNVDKFPITILKYDDDDGEYEDNIYLWDVLGDDSFTEEFCKYLIDLNPENVLSIPGKRRTVDMYKILVKEVGCNRTLYYPKELFDDDEFCDIVVSACDENKPFSAPLFKRIPKDKISKEKWVNVVNLNYYMFAHIPDEYKDVEMCRMVLNHWSLGITYVPRYILDENPDMWKDAIRDNLNAYRYIPDDLRESKECKDLVKAVIDEAMEEIRNHKKGDV